MRENAGQNEFRRGPELDFFLAAKRHQERQQREQQHGIEHENQRRRHGRTGAERGQRQPRPHITDVGIGPENPLDGRFADIAARNEKPDAEREEERDIGAQRRRGDKAPVGQLFKRRRPDQLEEQRRQRDVNNEEIHPGEAALGDLHEAPAGKPEQDQAEKREGKGNDGAHRPRLTARSGQADLPAALDEAGQEREEGNRSSTIVPCFQCNSEPNDGTASLQTGTRLAPPPPSLLDRARWRTEAIGFEALAALVRALGPDRASAVSGALWQRFAPLNKRHARAEAQMRAALPEMRRCRYCRQPPGDVGQSRPHKRRGLPYRRADRGSRPLHDRG